MAPKRQRKVGMKRIDGAIDALVPCGFSKETISSTIKTLLEVYDDAAAWNVIEEDNYRLVIDTILEDQEQEEKQHDEEKAMAETKASEADGTETNNGLEQQSVKDHGHSSSAAREVESLPPLDSSSQQNLPDSCPCHQQSQPYQLTGSRPQRPPCYGWLSETESDSEDEDRLSQPALRVRKRPIGWDVRPSDP